MRVTKYLLAILVAWGAQTAAAAPFAYINCGNDDIAVIDTATDTVITYMASDPGLGMTAAPGGALMYVTNTFFDSVSSIDTSTHTIVDTFPVGDGPGAIAIDPTGNRLYVYLEIASSIDVISTATGFNVGSIPIGTAGAGIGLAMHPGGAKLYVNVPGFGEVKVIATASNTIIDAIPVGAGPNGVVVNPAGTRLYVANQIAGSVSVVDTATDSVVDTIVTGGGPYNMTVHPDGTRLYVGNLIGSSVFVIDTGTNNVVTTINIGNLPTGLSVLPDGTKLYVTNRGDDNVSVIDTATNTELYRIAVGDQPTAIGQFIPGVQSNSASTIAATGTLALALLSFTGSLTFDSMHYSVFGTPVNLGSAISGSQMVANLNITGVSGGGLDFSLYAGASLPSFFLGGLGKLAVSGDDSFHISIPVLTPTGAVLLPNGPVYTLLAKIDRIGASPIWSGPFSIHAHAAANTPIGSDVVVPVTANVQFCPASLFEIPVSVGFDSVTSSGTTLVTGTCQAPGSIPPNIRLDVGSLVFFFDVSTTAGYTPPITVCGSYPDATNDGVVDGTAIDETTLELLHDAGGAGNFQPVANQSIDTVLNRICGEVMSLSPFLLASKGVPKGFVPSDSVARKCENKVLKQSSNLLKGILKCNRQTAEAALKGQTFDAEGCEGEARAKYDDKVAGLSGCPACLLTNAVDVGDAAEGAAEALTSNLYCAGTTILGGEDLGFVPTDPAAARCAKQRGKHAAKLGKKLGKCYRKHVDAVFKAKSFDLDACLTQENAEFDNGVGVLVGCPSCATASAGATRNRIERFSVEILSDVYCAGSTALP